MRQRQPSLRGSVSQNTIYVRPRRATSRDFLIRLGALAAGFALVIGLAFWLWHIGWPQREAEHLVDAGLRMTQKARFAVKDIVVEGRQQTAKDTLFAALGTSSGAPILSFDPAAAQARIAKLPWIASVTVERRLPDTILVRLAERVPMARWQHQGRTVVIDGEGKELPEAKLDRFAALPLVVGPDAPVETKILLDALKDYPAVTKAMTAAVRVGERRWDLHLEPKAVARLPEKDIAPALASLSDLIVKQKILERDVAAIDLRVSDRLIIEPGSGAARPSGGAPL